MEDAWKALKCVSWLALHDIKLGCLLSCFVLSGRSHKIKRSCYTIGGENVSLRHYYSSRLYLLFIRMVQLQAVVLQHSEHTDHFTSLSFYSI